MSKCADWLGTAVAGAIPALVKLLGSDSEAVQCGAATAFGNLAGSAATPQASAETAIKPLVALLDSRSPPVQLQAAAALSTLASNHPANQEAIIQAGAISRLKPLLDSKSLAMRAQAHAAFCNLASSTDQVPTRQAAAFEDKSAPPGTPAGAEDAALRGT